MRKPHDAVVERLYQLLPEVYRTRDVDTGGALHALIHVIAEQHEFVDANLRELYDNQFIDTCAEWVVPYIGDLIGCSLLRDGGHGVGSRRAEVANAIRYRRRKGTLSMIRGLAADVTGWGIEVTERANELATFNALERRAFAGGTNSDVRHGGTFAKRADVRRIAQGYGGYALAAVEVRVWRMTAYPVDASPAVRSGRQERHQYYFHPAGVDTPLFSNDDDGISRPITRARLRGRLSDFVGQGKPLNIALGGRDLEPSELKIVDLGVSAQRWPRRAENKHLLDPEVGRFVLAAAEAAPPIVNFSYGFSADIGGGPYNRPPEVHSSLEKQAIAKARTFAKPLKIEGSRTLELAGGERIGGRVEINVMAGRRLEMRAAVNAQAVIAATDFTISGDGTAEVSLSGIMVVGATLRVRGKLARLSISDCTFNGGPLENADTTKPYAPSIVVEPGIESVHIARSLLRRVETDRDTHLCIVDSIIDAGSKLHVALGGVGERYSCGLLTLERSTVIGEIRTAEVRTIADSIVMGFVTVERRANGTVRFSYVPEASRLPERLQCASDAEDEGMLRPHFVSRRYGDPAYFRLADYCSDKIRRGAEDESEMGVYHDSAWPILDSRLRSSLTESLPYQAEAGIVYAT